MNDNDILMRKAESHGFWRRALLVINAVAYIGWVTAEGLSHAGAFGLEAKQWGLIRMVIWPFWIITLIAIVIQIRRLARNRELASLVDDERTRHFKSRAFQAGYWALLAAITAIYTASYFMDIDVKTVMPFLLAAGASVPSLTYAFLYEG